MTASLLIAGLFVGFLSGLFGIGGGSIVVPTLSLLLTHWDISPDLVMPLAIGSSMAVVSVTALVALMAHRRHTIIPWPFLGRYLPGLLCGVVIGACSTHWLHGNVLRVCFIILCWVMAYRIGRSQQVTDRPPMSQVRLTLISLLAGGLSALLGIGGGLFTVPVGLRWGLPIQVAASAAVLVAVPKAVLSSVMYAHLGWGVADLPAGSTGYLYWPAILLILATSVFTAKIGVKCAHRISQRVLERAFAGFLLLVSASMLAQVFGVI